MKTVMIVDDAKSMRGLVSMTLNNSGYHVIEAAHGKEALEKLEQERVHLVISDVNMPVMNGIDFLSQMKNHPRLKYIPVVMLTTHGEESFKKQGQQYGAKAWIVKPFKPDTITKIVEKIIGS